MKKNLWDFNWLVIYAYRTGLISRKELIKYFENIQRIKNELYM
jgi:hypothetical protein